MKEYRIVNTIQDKYKNYNIKVDIYNGVVYDNHFHWFAYEMCIEIDLNLRFKFLYIIREIEKSTPGRLREFSIYRHFEGRISKLPDINSKTL